MEIQDLIITLLAFARMASSAEFSVLASSSSSSSTSYVAKKFGESCSNETGEFCQVGVCSENKICECLPNQIFDSTLTICVNLIGEGCKFDFDCVKFGLCKPEWNTTEGRFVGKCRCGLKHFESPSEKICERRARFGESCHEVNKPCEFGPLIECSNATRKCQCKDEKTQMYDPHRKTCVIRTGHICYEYRARADFNPCTTNARCNYFFNLMKEAQMPECKCLDGYLETKEGFCHGGFGKSCNSTSPCNSETAGLICSNAICQCDSPLHQIYDEKQGKCASLVGTSCKGENDTSCITHASCQSDTSNEIAEFYEYRSRLLGEESLKTPSISKGNTCQCEPGVYTRTFANTCKLDQGQRCIENGLVSGGDRFSSSKRKRFINLQCNSDAGLACKRGKCQCFDSSLIYDKEKRFCANPEPKGFCGVLNDKKMGIKAMVGCSRGNICAKITDDGSGKCSCRPLNETLTYERCLNYDMIELV